MRHRGFTLVELLVAVTILASLVAMASGVFVIYIRESNERLLGYNLNCLRSAIQHFYLDNGRYPFDDVDFHGNRISFLDSNTSELVQGVHSGLDTYPSKRYRYLQEMPIDPTTNLVNWVLFPHDSDGDWKPAVHDIGIDGTGGTGDFGEGDGVPNCGEPKVDEDPLDGIDDDSDGLTDEDPPDVKNVRSSNRDFYDY